MKFLGFFEDNEDSIPDFFNVDGTNYCVKKDSCVNIKKT